MPHRQLKVTLSQCKSQRYFHIEVQSVDNPDKVVSLTA